MADVFMSIKARANILESLSAIRYIHIHNLLLDMLYLLRHTGICINDHL